MVCCYFSSQYDNRAASSILFQNLYCFVCCLYFSISPPPEKKLSQQFSFTIHKKIRCVVKRSSPFPLSFFLFVLSLLVEQYYLHDMVLIFCCWSGGLFSRQSTNFLWKQTNELPNQECNITLRLINESSFFVTNKI